MPIGAAGCGGANAQPAPAPALPPPPDAPRGRRMPRVSAPCAVLRPAGGGGGGARNATSSSSSSGGASSPFAPKFEPPALDDVAEGKPPAKPRTPEAGAEAGGPRGACAASRVAAAEARAAARRASIAARSAALGGCPPPGRCMAAAPAAAEAVTRERSARQREWPRESDRGCRELRPQRSGADEQCVRAGRCGGRAERAAALRCGRQGKAGQ